MIVSRIGFPSSTILSIASSALTTTAGGTFGLEELATLSASAVPPFFFLPRLVVEDGAFGAFGVRGRAADFLGLALRLERLETSGCKLGVEGADADPEILLPVVEIVRLDVGLSGEASLNART